MICRAAQRCTLRRHNPPLNGITLGGLKFGGGRGFLFPDEGVAGFEAGEAGEVAVGSPEFADAVVEAEGGDAGVVDGAAANLAGVEQFEEDFLVAGAFAEEDAMGILAIIADGGHGLGGSGGGGVNAWIGGDGDEFVDRGPGDGPAFGRFRKSGHGLMGRCVVAMLAEERVNEKVGVNGDHVPRPW